MFDSLDKIKSGNNETYPQKGSLKSYKTCLNEMNSRWDSMLLSKHTYIKIICVAKLRQLK